MVARSEIQTETCLSFRQRGGGFGLQRILGDFDDLRKAGCVLCRDVRKNLSIKRALRSLQSFHEAAIGQTGFAHRGIDARLPQITEFTLAALAITIGVLTSVVDCIGSVAVKLRALEAKALGGTNHSRASFAGSWSVGNSHGLKS